MRFLNICTEVPPVLRHLCLICRRKSCESGRKLKEIEGFSGDTSSVNHWLDVPLLFSVEHVQEELSSGISSHISDDRNSDNGYR